jgi:histidine triad (HIT) family protein
LPETLRQFNEASSYQGDDIYCDVIIPRTVYIKVLHETDMILAFEHTRPRWYVHYVVTPKRHVASLLELADQPEQLQKELLATVNMVAKKVRDEHGHCRVLTNLGDYQDSKHLHIHIYSE